MNEEGSVTQQVGDEISASNPKLPSDPVVKFNYREAAQAVVPVMLCLAVGIASKNLAAGAIAAGGAFTVGFAPFNAVSKSPALSMLITGFGIGISAFVGNLCGLYPLTLYLGTAVWSLFAGYLVAVGKHPAWIGLQMAIFFVVSAYFAKDARYAIDRGVLLLAGGFLQWILYVTKWLLTKKERNREWISRFHTNWNKSSDVFSRALDFDSAYTWYATRVTAGMLLSTFIYRQFEIKNGYWIPMTAILVMKPNWADTRARGIARMIGTVAGGILASLLILFYQPDPTVLGVLSVIFAWLCYSLQNANYSVFSCAMTFYIVFLMSLGGFLNTARLFCA